MNSTNANAPMNVYAVAQITAKTCARQRLLRWGSVRPSTCGRTRLMPIVENRQRKKRNFFCRSSPSSQGTASARVWSSRTPSAGSRTISSISMPRWQRTQVNCRGSRCPLAPVP